MLFRSKDSASATAADIPENLDTKPYDNMGHPEQLHGQGDRPAVDGVSPGAREGADTNKTDILLDSSGNPKKLYHGTSTQSNSLKDTSSLGGIFLTADKKAAEKYAKRAVKRWGGNPIIHEVYAKVKNINKYNLKKSLEDAEGNTIQSYDSYIPQ